MLNVVSMKFCHGLRVQRHDDKPTVCGARDLVVGRKTPKHPYGRGMRLDGPSHRPPVRPLAEADVADSDYLVVPHWRVLRLQVQDEPANLRVQGALSLGPFGLEQGAHALVLEAVDPAAQRRLRGPGLAGPFRHGAAEDDRRADPLVLDLFGPLQEQLEFRPLLGGLDPPSPRHPFSPFVRRRLERPPASRSSPQTSAATTPAEAKKHATRRRSRPTFHPKEVQICVMPLWRGLF